MMETQGEEVVLLYLYRPNQARIDSVNCVLYVPVPDGLRLSYAELLPWYRIFHVIVVRTRYGALSSMLPPPLSVVAHIASTSDPTDGTVEDRYQLPWTWEAKGKNGSVHATGKPSARDPYSGAGLS